ncbi:uncharacterized protein LOC111000961 isoform X2 [Pieris rapae]|uniref:uncharacterized protein LOC111000961 isoform X2 n=1 Tax=Pieris rapae TaxID=64459 RepID=UPI001E27B4C3|nr:uncharacterized protein LOC111000961 isoform X2 [Pieris rapae]
MSKVLKVLTMALRCVVALLAVTCTHALNQYQNQYGNFQNNQGFRQPQFPTITMPPIKPMVFPTFPTFPTFSPQDIINQQGGPGVNFNGAAISSSSFTKVDQDGKVQRGGLTKIITNRNGVIEERTYPDDGSNINIVSSFPQPNIPKLPLPVLLVPPFPQIKVPFIPLPPVPKIDPIVIPKYSPGPNEEFRGRSIVSYRHSSDINGARSSGGVDTIISNENGRVDKKTFKYGDLNDDY